MSTRIRRKRYSFRCANCGNKFTATRRDAIYCTPYCRTDACRKRHEPELRVDADGITILDETGMKPVSKQPHMIKVNNNGEVYSLTLP